MLKPRFLVGHGLVDRQKLVRYCPRFEVSHIHPRAAKPNTTLARPKASARLGFIPCALRFARPLSLADTMPWASPWEVSKGGPSTQYSLNPSISRLERFSPKHNGGTLLIRRGPPFTLPNIAFSMSLVCRNRDRAGIQSGSRHPVANETDRAVANVAL